MPTTPRTTQQLIARTGDDLKSIQGAEEFWRHMVDVKFASRYRDALIAAGVPSGKAAEIADMVRQYTERIAGGLETATYLLRELAAEVDEARRLAGAQANEGGFRV